MSTTPAPRPMPRHALNMPAGSIRALLAFGVLAYLWLLVLLPVYKGESAAQVQVGLPFIYLQFLMVLILAHFFTAHGHTIGSRVSERSPLGLPAGSVRFLLLAGYIGLGVYLYMTGQRFQLTDTGPIFVLLLVMTSAYFLGYVLTGMIQRMYGGWLPPWAQDMQAWFAIVALVVLGIILLVRLVINPGLPIEKEINLDIVEAILAGLVGFYFGARS